MTKATEWAARLEAWRASGKSAADFCAEHGYSAKNLVWWSSHLRRKAKSPTKSKRVILARVVRRREATRPSPAAIVVRLGNAQVEVVGGADRAALSLVFETLVAATGRRG
ncbi:MAG: IS66 family insertion sequence element accessory protein TnpA [Steroidobacteraceae bacterium]